MAEVGKFALSLVMLLEDKNSGKFDSIRQSYSVLRSQDTMVQRQIIKEEVRRNEAIVMTQQNIDC